MIKFLSLYLGLVTGAQPVEVVVGAEVARVEYFLDGESVGEVTAEPWSLEVDCGSRLLPRRLEAVAYDEARSEIGRAEQLLNVPRPSAEIGVVLDRDEGGKVVAARINWQSVARDTPREVNVLFDGEPLAVTDPARVEVPDHDPRQFHFLSVEMSFQDWSQAQAVASFGGAHLSETATELTAVAVIPARSRLSVDELQGAVTIDGQAVQVASIDRGRGDILFVRDIEAGALIEAIGRSEARGLSSMVVRSSGTTPGVPVSSGNSVQAGAAATPDQQLNQMLMLDAAIRVRLMWPATKQVERGKVRMDLFPASPASASREGGVFWALTQTISLDGTSDIQRLADAVAVAGLEAAAENRRRAVVLVLGPQAEDHSRYDAATVRAFLDSLDVPLFVWAVGVKKKASVYEEWGDVRVIRSLRDLRDAVRVVEKHVERQRIVWIAGRHLPNSIELTGSQVASANL